MYELWRRLKNFFVLLNARQVKLLVGLNGPAPLNYYHATSVAEAEDVMSSFVVTDCRLTYELGEETGLDLIRWMERCNIWPRNRPIVTGSNVFGLKAINVALDRTGIYGITVKRRSN